MVEAAPDVQEEPKQNGHHKLNSEVEKAVDSQKINGSKTTVTDDDATHEKRSQNDVDAEAQQLVIDSLRSQVQDLFSQVNELNNKLVKSYDRVSDLEDDLHVASEANRSSSLKISQLESEREQHLSALNTGLLVEKSQVTAELTRLMEKATEEAAQRGQAESARQAIEQDLDDLSATLFGQANTMVAEARFARHESEQKVENAERNLKSAEEAVSAMQQQIQVLRTEKEEAERKAEASQTVLDITTGKGMSKRSSQNPIPSLRLLSSHSPYQEFLLFVAHLRSVHSSSSQPPAISSLLPLPFLARLLTEDSEPTIRFDLAPSLNWLSRRSVLAAIHNGQLIIEPMSSMTFLQEVNPSGSMNSGNVSCALCGASIFSASTAGKNTTLPLPSVIAQSNSGSTSWSAALFKKPSATNYSISTNNSVPSTPTPRQSLQQVSPLQVYIFKLAIPSSAMSSIPIPSLPRATNTASTSLSPVLSHTDNHASYTSSPNPQQSSTIYPLCTNNWCLSRLRSTCSLWAFVRSGIVEKIWEEEVPTLPIKTISPTREKPPIPPRRRGLWSMASALGERATSWGEGDKAKAKKPKAAEKSPSSTSPPSEPKSDRRRLPPPLPPKAAFATTTTKAAAIHAKPATPPPLPKRSEVRQASPPAVPAPATPAVPTEKSAKTIVEDKEETSAAPLASTETPAAISASDDQVQTSVTDIPDTTAVSAPEPKLPPRPPRRPMNPESRPQTPPIANVTPGNSAPPPLPRRAATRASRMPVDSSTPSRTPTPVEPITESNTEEADQMPKEESSKRAGSPSPDATATTEDDTKDGELLVNRSVVSPSVEEEVFVDANSGSGSESGNEEGKLGKATEGGVDAGSPEGSLEVENQVEETAEDKDEEKVETDKEKVEKDEAKMEKLGEEAKENVEEKAETKIKEKEEDIDTTKTGEEIAEKTEIVTVKPDVDENAKKEKVVPSPDTQTTGKKEAEKDTGDSTKLPANDSLGNYVGDATWEERTWKEIIRLKETMFWARIGGSKQ